MNWELFLKKYNEASVTTRAFIDSDKIPLLAEKMVQTGIGSVKTASKITLVLSDFVLEIIDKNHLKNVLGLADTELESLQQKLISLQNNDSLFEKGEEKSQSIQAQSVAEPFITTVIDAPKAPGVLKETVTTPQVTLGTVPDASNDLKERLELRPKNVIRQSFAEPKIEEPDEEDDGPKPLTRTQILQSLTSKRTMASDIASIHKSGDTNTHTSYSLTY